MEGKKDDKNLWDWLTTPIDARVIKVIAEAQAKAALTNAEATKSLNKTVENWMSDIEDDVWKNLVDYYKNSGLINESQAESIYSLKDTATPMNWIMFIMASITMARAHITATMDPMQAFISQSQNKELRPGLPNYNDVINAAFIAPEKTGQVVDVMHKFGIPDDMIDLLFISNYRLYDVTQVKDLYLRGVLSEGEMFVRMRELGFTDTRIKEIVQSWEVIPGPQDLFWMVGKEAFEPDSIQGLGLDAEFPQDQLEWLSKQGISEDWARRYWYAHWDQPSIGQGYEMLHRGVIDDDLLDLLFRTVEIPPFWRERLKAIAYSPYARVDVRRMHDMGVLSDEELIKAYMDIGYDKEHAYNLASFTVLYNQANDKDLTRSQLMNAYDESILSREVVKELLMELGYDRARAEFIIEFADYERELQYQKDLIKNITDQYILRLIDRKEAERELIQLNLQSTRIKIILEKADLKVYKNRAKIPKTDLEKMYKASVIDDDELRFEMDKLGYSYDQIDKYIKLYKIAR